MNELSIEDRTRILSCLIEGMSVRATSRITGAAKGTILRLVRTIGPACAELMDRYFVDLPCNQIQLDECWAFVRAKDAALPNNQKQGAEGSVWTWIATCRDSKLIIDYAIGDRSVNTATAFLTRLARRVDHRVQITTDGFKTYMTAILRAFKLETVDYAMEIKEYGSDVNDENATTGRKYSPPRIKSWDKEVKLGDPDLDRASTSHAERIFLSLRMENRRFTRLTNAHSKKIEYHRAMFAIWCFYYNMIRKHSALRGKTPAMAAGITEHPFTLRDVLFALDQVQAAA
jgi:IS1 family transposase